MSPAGIDLPPVAVEQVGGALREHPAPGRRRRRQPEAEEAQRGEEDDRVGDLEGRVHDDRPERVRDEVPHDDAQPARRPSCVTAWTNSRVRSDSVSPRTSRAGPSQDSSESTTISSGDRGPEDRRQVDEHEDRRDREHDVDDPHHDRVEQAPGKAGDRAPRGRRSPSRAPRPRSRSRAWLWPPTISRPRTSKPLASVPSGAAAARRRGS